MTYSQYNTKSRYHHVFSDEAQAVIDADFREMPFQQSPRFTAIRNIDSAESFLKTRLRKIAIMGGVVVLSALCLLAIFVTAAVWIMWQIMSSIF
jgi:hypothetical protein